MRLEFAATQFAKVVDRVPRGQKMLNRRLPSVIYHQLKLRKKINVMRRPVSEAVVTRSIRLSCRVEFYLTGCIYQIVLESQLAHTVLNLFFAITN